MEELTWGTQKYEKVIKKSRKMTYDCRTGELETQRGLTGLFRKRTYRLT